MKCWRPIPSFNYVTNAQMGLFCNASKKLGNGWGIIYKNEWAQACWDQEFLKNDPSIMLLKLFAIVMCVIIWGKELENQHVILQSDSESAVNAANAQFSLCDLCMTLICFLVLECLHYNIDLKCQHICGVNNLVSDALSHCQFQRFRKLVPDTLQEPQQISSKIWPLLMDLLKNAKL